ncbi:hypothetical protein O9993_03195 [Vibrio lentus]|nr:hypothetical protein [Vibrio lentus]
MFSASFTVLDKKNEQGKEHEIILRITHDRRYWCCLGLCCAPSYRDCRIIDEQAVTVSSTNKSSIDNGQKPVREDRLTGDCKHDTCKV